MRDPARIDGVLAQLRETWMKLPDWRLGQLIFNAINPPGSCPGVFYTEDDDLQKKLAALSARIKVDTDETFGQESHG